MFRRLRQLRIPLAAKCQLLFGIAAIAIIAAALFVPWQRMEQLTEQLNERAAQTVARLHLAEHVRVHSDASPATRPASIPTTGPAEPPRLLVDGVEVRPPQLLGVERIEQFKAERRFEHAALVRFQQRADLAFFARSFDSPEAVRYRYAEPVLARGQCLDCHASPAAATLPADAGEPLETAGTQPAAALLGVVSVEIPTQISTRQLLLNRVFMLLAGLLAGTLAIVILYLIITRLILKPVRVLQETAEKVSQGDLNIRSDISSGDEFQQLSETFNTMLRNLKESADRLQAMNKSLDTRLGQLAEANVSLFESNRLKSEFLASVSHELRTPLNSILGFAELLRDASPAAADVKHQRYIQNIARSGKNLLELINDLLDLAKIEAGRMDVRVESISLGDVFEGLVTLLRPLCEQQKATIATLVSPSVPIIRTDPAKLQQVLYNFLSNAIKFSPPNERIDLQARLEPGGLVRISVTDRGPGIPADKQEVIFEKFRQLDQSMTRQHSGTGLGLAIARELTTLLGGRIGVESGPGGGSTFWIVIPLEIEPSTHDVRGKG